MQLGKVRVESVLNFSLCNQGESPLHFWGAWNTLLWEVEGEERKETGGGRGKRRGRRKKNPGEFSSLQGNGRVQRLLVAGAPRVSVPTSSCFPPQLGCLWWCPACACTGPGKATGHTLAIGKHIRGTAVVQSILVTKVWREDLTACVTSVATWP